MALFWSGHLFIVRTNFAKGVRNSNWIGQYSRNVVWQAHLQTARVQHIACDIVSKVALEYELIDCFALKFVNWCCSLYYSSGVINCCWHNSKLIWWYGAFIMYPLLFTSMFFLKYIIISLLSLLSINCSQHFIEPDTAPFQTTPSSIFSSPGASQTRASSSARYPPPWPSSPRRCFKQRGQQASNSGPLHEEDIETTKEASHSELFSISTEEVAFRLQTTPFVKR